jgi:triacylglycerol lipase
MFKRCAISIFVFTVLALNIPAAADPTPTGHKKECVILLHGMARTTSSMHDLETYLSGKGYKTVNLAYPSTSESIERIAAVYLPRAIAQCKDGPVDKIHFVTHSLGGIIVRQYLQTNSLPEGSRLVMLAPPNQGTEVVDHLKDFFVYQWIHGPSGQELGTDPASTPNRLKPINIEVGIIAGDMTLNPILSSLIPGPDDGKVSVERAKLREMTDFLVVPSTHTFIMKNPDVLAQVDHFLVHGKFDHSRE